MKKYPTKKVSHAELLMLLKELLLGTGVLDNTGRATLASEITSMITSRIGGVDTLKEGEDGELKRDWWVEYDGGLWALVDSDKNWIKHETTLLTNKDWVKQLKPALWGKDDTLVWKDEHRARLELALLHFDRSSQEEAIRQAGEEHTWTLINVSRDGGYVGIIKNGIHYLRAIGYYITEEPWTPNSPPTEIMVVDAITRP